MGIRNTCAKPGCSRRRGFSIVEVLIAIGVMLVLIGLILPIAASARSTARQTACMSNMRGACLVVASYTTDFRDRLPFAGSQRHNLTINGCRPIPVGGDAGLSNGRWALLFTDQWTGAEWNPGLRCPRQPALADLGRTDEANLPTYWMSSAIWFDPASLRESSTRPALRVRSNRVSDVLFPSKKVLLFEQIGYCADVVGDTDWINVIGQTFLFPTSVSTVDGAVRRMRQIDGLPALGTLPFELTIDGVRGRDLP